MRRSAMVFFAAALGGFGLLAQAALAADTSTTFALSGGALSITVPASTNLGTTGTGAAAISAQLGAVAVSDLRGVLLGSWTATVSSTDFKTGLATANETIGKANVYYWSGAATTTSGTGTFTPGQLLAGNEVSLGTSKTAFSAAAVVGNNSVAWNPTVDVHLPSAAVVGTYSGTITHSVA